MHVILAFGLFLVFNLLNIEFWVNLGFSCYFFPFVFEMNIVVLVNIESKLLRGSFECGKYRLEKIH